MEEISFLNDYDFAIPNKQDLIELCLKIRTEEHEHGSVNVVFTDDSVVKDLNKRFREKDMTTDVLSFNWHDEDILGEIYISVPQVTRQAPNFDNSYEDELKKMIVHGMLHLCDYDHINDDDYKKMSVKEKFYNS